MQPRRYAIEYAYPTSDTAEEVGCFSTGCYYIVWSDGSETKSVNGMPFLSEKEAEMWVSEVCANFYKPIRDQMVTLEVIYRQCLEKSDFFAKTSL